MKKTIAPGMKGYKGFAPGLVCRGKQYAENTVFEERDAEICKSGMHFCENPFDVLDYYERGWKFQRFRRSGSTG